MRARLTLAFCGWVAICFACSTNKDPDAGTPIQAIPAQSLEIFNCKEDAALVVFRKVWPSGTATEVGSIGATSDAMHCNEANAGSLEVELSDGVDYQILLVDNPGPSDECVRAPGLPNSCSTDSGHFYHGSEGAGVKSWMAR